MDQTLRSFLDDREALIKEQLKKLRLELDDIKKARRALYGDNPVDGKSTTESSERQTIKDMIRETLKSFPEGLASDTLAVKILDSHGKKVERSSLSPQLSRMKKDDELSLRGDLWVLRQPTSLLSNKTETTEIAEPHFLDAEAEGCDSQ